MLRRDTIIDPSMVNKEFKVHTGNSFKLIKICQIVFKIKIIEVCYLF